MNQELGFETIPFEIAPEFQGEVFEEESERGGRRSSPGPRSGFRSPYTAGQRPGRARVFSPTRPKKPPVRKPRPSGFRRRGPWGVPYGLVSEPYSGQPAPSGSEDMRWVQSALNDVLGLRLPVDGIMDAATRSAVRSFQQREGLPVDGIVGPDTREALLRARSGKTAPPPDGGDQATGTTAPDTEWEGEESLESFWDTLGSWWGGSSPGSSAPRPAAGLPPSSRTAPSSQPVLRRGSKGSAVTELQNRLAALGFSPGAADGIFGSLTEGAVKSFQRSRGITADGIVGSQTWGQLYAQPGTGGAQPSPIPSPAADRWALPADVRAAGEAQSVRYDSPPAWEDGGNCTGSFTQGAAELRQHILANFRGVAAIGGYSCRQNSANLKETSVHGVGRALDIMIPIVGGRAHGAIGDPIANWLVRNASVIGIQYIIWNRVSWGGNRGAPKDRSYTGPNPHIDHIHAELNKDGAERRTAWFQRKAIPMNQELGFETIPFEIAPEFQGEVFEEESERGGARSSPGPRSGFRSPYTAGQRPGRARAFSPTRPKKPPGRKPRPSGFRRRGPWGVPYGLVSEPYSGQPAPSGSEDMRWVQSALNDVLGLRLPVDGIMEAATRSAVRSFQQREGLPVDGIVGPDTREALLRARSGKTAPPPDGGDQAAGTTAPDTEWEGEESLESFWDTLGSWWGGSSPGSSAPRPPQPAPSSQPVLRRGSKGSAVTELQNRLAALGFSPGAADGIFGSLTEGAVKSFQRSRGITADGIVGSQTWSKLGMVAGTPPGTPSSGPSGGSGSIRYGKGWGGSEGVADAAKGIAASMGVPVTSQKRDLAATIRVGSTTGSDHYTGNTTAFATDFGVSGSRGDELARAIATKYGIPQSAIGTFTRYTIQVGDRRYSLQLLWRVKGHYDHVHLGIRRV